MNKQFRSYFLRLWFSLACLALVIATIGLIFKGR